MIAVNLAVRYTPFADILYSGSVDFWTDYTDDWQTFAGMKVTINQPIAERFGLTYCKHANKTGLGEGCLHGDNSGHQAVNLAYLLGAQRICLLGYDMQETGGAKHFHADHRCNTSTKVFPKWVRSFDRLHDELAEQDVTLVNCTRKTALNLPRMDLEDA